MPLHNLHFWVHHRRDYLVPLQSLILLFIEFLILVVAVPFPLFVLCKFENKQNFIGLILIDWSFGLLGTNDVGVVVVVVVDRHQRADVVVVDDDEEDTYG